MTASSEPVILARDVTRAFGRRRVVDGLLLYLVSLLRLRRVIRTAD